MDLPQQPDTQPTTRGYNRLLPEVKTRMTGEDGELGGELEPSGLQRETMSVGHSFDEAFSAEFAPLRAYFAKRLGTSAAEELTAETFAVAYRRWSDLDPSRPVRPWLYGIATNLAKHHWRRERRMLRAYARTGLDPVLTEEDVSLDRLDAQSAGAVLAAALAELRHEEREVILLYAWTGLTDTGIADALGLPIGTVKSRLSRARQHLRNHLGLIGQVEVETVAATEERR
jgi:RNA polymerase sigma-70 factor, ECF subfamily